MRPIHVLPVLVALAAAGLVAVPVDAQRTDQNPWAQRVGDALAPVPFGPGERLEYQVKVGAFVRGSGHMEVHGVEQVRGHRTYHISMGVRGGVPFARVDNLFQTWMDVETLAARRFIQDQDEVRTKRHRQFEFYPEEGRWERSDGEESGELVADIPLDDISFVYFARTLPLRVGETYELHQYFRSDRNPVIIEVLRKDRVEVPAGTFNTIVVRPTIKTRGLFGEGGEAEIHFSDDNRRLMVQMRSRIPVLRSLSFHLSSIEPGRSLRPLPTTPGGSDPP